jgi:hypothetical protein
MADNTLIYTLNLAGNLHAKLQKIIVANDMQLEKWSAVQKQVNAASSTMDKMGKSIGSMNQRIAALRAQKEWIPVENTVAIRATNREIKQLEASITKLNNLNGGMLSRWWGDLKSAMPFQMLTNPLVLATGALRKFNDYLRESEGLYKNQMEAETKLAAVLYDVVTESVGGVNAALAQTPEGQLKQHINAAGDLQERVGKLTSDIKNGSDACDSRMDCVDNRRRGLQTSQTYVQKI